MSTFNLQSTQDPKIRAYAPELATLYDMVHDRIDVIMNGQPQTDQQTAIALELARVELTILELWRNVIHTAPRETVEDRIRSWATELLSVPVFSDDLASEKHILLKKLSWVLNEPIVTASQTDLSVKRDFIKLQTWQEWVGKIIVKKSGKPFPDKTHSTIAGRIITNQHTGNPSFVIGGNDRWCVECRMCTLAE